MPFDLHRLPQPLRKLRRHLLYRRTHGSQYKCLLIKFREARLVGLGQRYYRLTHVVLDPDLDAARALLFAGVEDVAGGGLFEGAVEDAGEALDI